MGYNANTMNGSNVSNDTIVQQALNIAGSACNEINLILQDIQGGAWRFNEAIGTAYVNGYQHEYVNPGAQNKLGDSKIERATWDTSEATGTWTPAGATGYWNTTTGNPATGATVWTEVANDSDGKVESGKEVLDSYGISGEADITTAAGAMVIDDLMQKISTKVQVAAQLLSTANNIAKTASRVLSQG